jgi:Holliday junction DNA helicase RuvA
MEPGAIVEVFVYHQIKEDGQALFGFASIEELEFFELLISVSGVGPKSGLNIMSSSRLSDLKGAIAAGDHAPLTKVSGIGAKTAQRLVIELKNKVDWLEPLAGTGSALGEELEALMGLGYSREQARQALAAVPTDITDSSERLRQALRNL